MTGRIKLFFDGGCRGKPERMEVAVVVAGTATILPDLGPGSSMDAEWLALIEALRTARSLTPTEVVLLGDAAHVIAVARGERRCPRPFAHHFEAFQRLAGGDLPAMRYIPRTQNLAGIALARRHPR